MKRSSKQRLKSLLIALVTAAFCYVPATWAIEGAMDDMISSATSTSAGGNLDESLSSRRGRISGGSVRVRFNQNRVAPDVVSFQPPGFSAGCGGIDMHGGSLSFISAEELMQTLQQMAGPGVFAHALMLGLGQMCSPCKDVIQTLQEWQGKMNQFLKRSCEQNGQALYDGAQAAKKWAFGGAEKDKEMEESKDIDQDDAYEDSKKDPVEACKQDREIPGGCWDKKNGNIIWKELIDQTPVSWVSNAGGANNYYQLIMSITGTQIRSLEGAAKMKNMDITPVYPYAIKFQELIDGTEITGWKCTDGTGRQSCTETEVGTIISLSESIREKAVKELDPNRSGSIAQKFTIHYDGISLDSDQGQFMAAMNKEMAMTGKLRKYAVYESGIPPAYGLIVAEKIAAQIAFKVMEDAVMVAKEITKKIEDPVAKTFKERATKARDKAQEQLEDIQSRANQKLALLFEIERGLRPRRYSQ